MSLNFVRSTWQSCTESCRLHFFRKPYLFSSCSRVLLEKPTGFQLVKTFPAFYGTRKFNAAFISARHLSPSWASSIQSTPPHPSSSRYIIILFSLLRLCLPSGSFSSSIPTRTLYKPLFSPYVPHAPPIALFSILTPEKILGEETRSLSSSLCSFLHSLLGNLRMTIHYLVFPTLPNLPPQPCDSHHLRYWSVSHRVRRLSGVRRAFRATMSAFWHQSGQEPATGTRARNLPAGKSLSIRRCVQL